MANDKILEPWAKFFVALDFLVNLGGPFLVYQLATGRTSETAALMLSSAPPIFWSIGTIDLEPET
jgi:hypothetical protein